MPDTAEYAQERRELEAWFARYDAHAAEGDVETLASMALFPLNVVTDGADPGSGRAGQWSREEYLETMGGVLGQGGGDFHFDSVRTPQFLSPCLAVGFTHSTVTTGGESTEMHYADILVKQGEDWYFQTMVQGGWAGTAG